MVDEYFFADQIINFMNQNNVINSGLLTAFGVLVAGLSPAFLVNHWIGLVDLVAIVGVALIYHFFFNEK